MKDRDDNFDLVKCNVFRTLLLDGRQSAHICNSELTVTNSVSTQHYIAHS